MKGFRDFIFEQIGRMRIVMLGGPGSGKSTYAEYLIKHFDITHIYPGDMLRKEMEKSAKELDFKSAAFYRDQIKKMKFS